MNSNSIVVSDVRSNIISALGQAPSDRQDRLDIDGTVAFFRRRAGLILAVALAVVAIALVAVMTMQRTYRASARVMLTPDASAAGQAGSTQADQAAISNQLVDTQVEIITSLDMVQRVASALHLADGLSEAGREELYAGMQHNLSAQRTGESYALELTYDANSPERARDVVNAFVSQFTQWQLRADQNRNVEARQIVEGKLEKLQAQAQADTQALQYYRIANNLLSTSGASLTEQEISNYEQQVAMAKAQSAEDQARVNTALSQLRSGSNGDDVGEALSSPVIGNLRVQEADLAGKVANLSSRYGANHPELIRARSQLQEVRDQIQNEITRVISNLRAKSDVSSQRLASLTASLGVARGKLSQNNAAMVGLNDLERKADASQAIYDTYLGSYKQLLAAEGAERPSARVLSWASLPISPVSPNVKLDLALATVIGLGLGIVVAYVFEGVFHGVTTPEEIETQTGQTFLASIPLRESIMASGKGRSQALATVNDEPYGAFSEALRGLAVAVDQAVDGKPQVVAVTSALPNEGKTMLSCCLAHIYATSGMRTILIDCDLRRRGISRLLKRSIELPGLIEVLNGSAQLNFEQKSGETVFWTLPVSSSEVINDHLISGPQFAELIKTLRLHFDRIVLDLPPVLPIAYTRVLAGRADAVIVAAHWRKTSVFALKAALSRLPREHVHVAGVALNQVDLRRRSFFGKLDPTFYYQKYQDYYTYSNPSAS
ncbi:MAG: hypothetical protein KGM93_18365 [Sphingomonadales bacterium]|nr:hypothetical protein [Sphingomonadales bacterium]